MHMSRPLASWICGLGVALPLGLGGMAVAIAQPATTAPVPTAPIPTASPSTTLLTTMVKMASLTRQDMIYELGGDGQLATTVAKSLGNPGGLHIPVNGPNATGTEQVLTTAIAKTNPRQASVFFLWLSPDLNLKLRPALLSRLKPGSRIVSYLADMGEWQPDQTQQVAANTASGSPPQTLHAWTVPANLQGNWQGALAVNPGRTPQPFTLQFTQQFQKVKGLVVVDGKKVPMQKVSLVGDRLNFSRTEMVQGQQVTLVFTGKVDGDTLKGTADVQAGFLSRTFPIVAKRQS
jgi:hypothetical protein